MSVYADRVTLINCIVITWIIGAAVGFLLSFAARRIVHKAPVMQGKGRYWVKHLYPAVVFSLVCVSILLRFDLTFQALRNFDFICCLYVLVLTDLMEMMIPDRCHIAAVLIWIATLPFMKYDWKEILLHAVSLLVYGGGVLLLSLGVDKILKKESLGGGDVKLLGVMGLYLGLLPGLFALLVSCILSLIFSLIYRKVNPKEKLYFPFGPAIAAGTYIILLLTGP